MSDIGEIRIEAIDADALGRGSSFLETCRRYLADRKIPEQELPLFYCRLSETLLHRGHHENAVECARTAFDLWPETEETAHLCAWVFSNCGCYAEAAAAYERLLKFRPHWVEGHRHASGSFAAAGQADRAIGHAKTASDRNPGYFEFAFHAGCLLESARFYEEAADYFARAAGIEPGDCSALRHLSTVKFALDHHEDAVALALRALALAPDDRSNALHATELLLRTGGFDEAFEIISETVHTHPRDAVALRLLSAAQMLRGRTEDALGAIDRALAIAPEVVEYHLHRANLLYRLGYLDEAAEAFGQAAALDPSNPDAKRSQLTVYFDTGRFTEALAIGGELIKASPDNDEYAQAVLQILNRRFEILDADFVLLSERELRPRRQLRPPPGFFARLQT